MILVTPLILCIVGIIVQLLCSAVGLYSIFYALKKNKFYKFKTSIVYVVLFLCVNLTYTIKSAIDTYGYNRDETADFLYVFLYIALFVCGLVGQGIFAIIDVVIGSRKEKKAKKEALQEKE